MRKVILLTVSLSAVHKIPTNKWTFVAFTYAGSSGLGTFFVDDKYGYQDEDGKDHLVKPVIIYSCLVLLRFKHRSLQTKHFMIKNENWTREEFKFEGKLGASKHFPTTQSFTGHMSCLQIFGTSLSQAEIHYLKVYSIKYKSVNSKSPFHTPGLQERLFSAQAP